MKNVIIGGFHQETNSFNPVISDFGFFQRSNICEGEEIRSVCGGKPSCIGGMMDAITSRADVRMDLAYMMAAQSGGPVEQAVVVHFLDKMKCAIEKSKPVDGVFLYLHGATQTTAYDDCCGFILEEIRNCIGEEAIIAVTTDLHANITLKMTKYADIICGYQTYPHLDFYDTGYRAASLGLSCLLDHKKLYTARAAVPMIVPASAYSTMDGSFAKLMREAQTLVQGGEILDFSIYQMQPWLDVTEGGSAVLVVDKDKNVAAKYAAQLAERLLSLRNQFDVDVYSIDKVLALAENNKLGKPIILVDSADSSNAGATGDSVEVIQALLDRGTTLKTAFIVNDGPAANRAHELGVGKTVEFSLGATISTELYTPIRVKAYIKSLHDGIFCMEGPAGRGILRNVGKTATLQVGNIDIVVCQNMTANGDPQLYRAFGVEPTFYQLVVVKACTSFRAAYSLFAEKICPTDTPGAARVDLKALPFTRLPSSFYPFSDLDDYVVKDVSYSRQ